MNNLNRLTSVADIDAAALIAQKMLSQASYRKTAIDRQVSNSQGASQNIADDIASLNRRIAGLNKTKSIATGSTADVDAQLANLQSQLAEVQNRVINYGPVAIQMKLVLAEMCNIRVTGLNTYIAELAAKRATLSA